MNWTLFAIIFSIGTYLSYQKVYGTVIDKEPAGRLENLYLILLEIELPTTLLIALVVWTVLLPESFAVDNTDEVLNFNSYVLLRNTASSEYQKKIGRKNVRLMS